MLLKNEIKVGEVYVNDKDFILREEEPALWRLVKEPEEKTRSNLMGQMETYETQPIWENIETGELVDWGAHCFTTLERMERMYLNIDNLYDKSRADYITKATKMICAYSDMNNAVLDHDYEALEEAGNEIDEDIFKEE